MAPGVSECSPGEHDECFVVAAKVAIPTAGLPQRAFERVRESIGVLIAHLELDERPGLRLSCLNVTEIRSRDLRRREHNGVEDSADLQALRDQGPNHDHGETIVSARSRPPVRSRSVPGVHGFASSLFGRAEELGDRVRDEVGCLKREEVTAILDNTQADSRGLLEGWSRLVGL
jgi:hypothetical protein